MTLDTEGVSKPHASIISPFFPFLSRSLKEGSRKDRNIHDKKKTLVDDDDRREEGEEIEKVGGGGEHEKGVWREREKRKSCAATTHTLHSHKHTFIHT